MPLACPLLPGAGNLGHRSVFPCSDSSPIPEQRQKTSCFTQRVFMIRVLLYLILKLFFFLTIVYQELHLCVTQLSQTSIFGAPVPSGYHSECSYSGISPYQHSTSFCRVAPCGVQKKICFLELIYSVRQFSVSLGSFVNTRAQGSFTTETTVHVTVVLAWLFEDSTEGQKLRSEGNAP